MKKIIFMCFVLFFSFNSMGMYRPNINVAINPSCPQNAPFQYMEDGRFVEKRWFDGKVNECLSCDSEDPFSFDYLPDQELRKKMSQLCPNRIWENGQNWGAFFRKKCPSSKPVFSPHAHKCKSCQEMFIEQQQVLYDLSKEACRLCPNASYYPKDGMAKCHFTDMKHKNPTKQKNNKKRGGALK